MEGRKCRTRKYRRRNRNRGRKWAQTIKGISYWTKKRKCIPLEKERGPSSARCKWSILALVYERIDWQKAFDHVNWTKLMQILKRTGIDWCERRLISKLYVDQKVKVRMDQGETRSVQIGRRVRQGCCLSPILFNLYSEWLTKEALDGLGNFNMRGQIIQTVK